MTIMRGVRKSTPRMEKVTLVAQALELEAVMKQFIGFHLITKQAPQIIYANQAVDQFQIKKNQPLGAKVTLRGQIMEDFLHTLVYVALPKASDFSPFSTKNMDKQGNITFHVSSFLLWPECEPFYEVFRKVGGFHISLVTSTSSQSESLIVYNQFDLPMIGDDLIVKEKSSS